MTGNTAQGMSSGVKIGLGILAFLVCLGFLLFVLSMTGGGDSTSPAPATVPSGMIKCKVIKLFRADGKAEYISIPGIDIYDASGARITSGITPTVYPILGSDAAHFGPQFLIDGKHEKYNAADPHLPHTMPDKNAYMQLDLGQDTVVSKIVVWNKTDGGTGDRILGCKITATNTAGTEVFSSTFTAPSRDSYTWSAPGTSTTST